MNETISALRGHTLRLALLGTGAAILWATFTLLLGALSPASADTADAAPLVLTSTTSTLLPAEVDAVVGNVVALPVAGPVANIVAEVAAPVAHVAPPAVTALIAPGTAAVAPVIALVEPVLVPVTSVLPPIVAPLAPTTARLVDAAALVDSAVQAPVAVPGTATGTSPSPDSATPSDGAERPAVPAASTLVIAPVDSPIMPAPSAPATPALLPVTSVNAAGGNAAGAASNLPSGRSAERDTPGVLALFGDAALPSAPTFDPGSTPD